MIRAARNSLAAVCAALIASIGLAAPAGAAGHVVAPGESIQDAIDAASPGDSIILQPGVYEEDLEITTDGITIVGNGATLSPPASPTPQVCDESAPPGPPVVHGICIAGEVDFETLEIIDPISDVKVIGLHIQDFSGLGILIFGGENAQFIANTLTDNGEYGIGAFVSTGTKMIANHVSGSEEAGLYVGDSPDANAKILANDTSDNLFGVFIRDAEQVKILGNRTHGNCAGILFLADAPGPAGDAEVAGNFVTDNTRLCPATDESPPLSGTGVLLLGAHDVRVRGNIITGNNPDPAVGDTPFSGGVVVVTGLEGTAPNGNRVNGNIIVDNTPDIRWDGTGADNSLAFNVCDTSDPAGIC
jgi:Right handed beta helix region